MDDWKHDHLGNQIIILSNQVKHYLHQAAEVEGISGSQSRILHYISEFSKKTEVYQKDVEEFFYLRRSTVTQTLQTMEKNGLIKRSSVSRDARLKKLELTGAGQALISSLAFCTFGNATTSRRLSACNITIARRSRPMPRPP